MINYKEKIYDVLLKMYKTEWDNRQLEVLAELICDKMVDEEEIETLYNMLTDPDEDFTLAELWRVADYGYDLQACSYIDNWTRIVRDKKGYFDSIRNLAVAILSGETQPDKIGGLRYETPKKLEELLQKDDTDLWDVQKLLSDEEDLTNTPFGVVSCHDPDKPRR